MKGPAARRTCVIVESVHPGEADDRRARFEAVAREVVDPLRRFLARRTDEATADDVLAETLLVCWRRFDELPAEPLPYVYGVARHALQNAERSARRQRRVAGKVAVLDPPREASDTPDDPGVGEALARLPEADAEVVRLWAWEQLTPAEIATVLDVTPNAVSIRLHRAKARLREELRKTEEPSGHEGSDPRRRR